jgi:hypothetical protein
MFSKYQDGFQKLVVNKTTKYTDITYFTLDLAALLASVQKNPNTTTPTSNIRNTTSYCFWYETLGLFPYVTLNPVLKLTVQARGLQISVALYAPIQFQSTCSSTIFTQHGPYTRLLLKKLSHYLDDKSFCFAALS